MSKTRIKNFSEDAQQGLAALQRLLDLAHENSGQPRIVARFLMSLYEGERFPFDLTDFRCLDSEIFADCLVVLKLDISRSQKVHRYIEDGENIWELLAQRWGFHDHQDGSWR